MSLLRPTLASSSDTEGAFVPEESVTSDPPRWKDRFDDPLNRVFRYPLARLIVRGLIHTPVTPNQVTFVQPFLAAAAGYCVTFSDRRHLLLAALFFEVRSILDCVDGTLARARKTASPAGHAIDGITDWLATALLFAGIFWRFHINPPPAGAWGHYVPAGIVVALALFQGAIRSFAADWFRTKIVSVFETGRDQTVEPLRRKASRAGASIFARADVFIGRLEHLAFTGERVDADGADDRAAARLAAREGTPFARAVAALWSVTNGDAFLSMVVLSILFNKLWEAMVFFASFGLLWVVAVIALSARLVRR